MNFASPDDTLHEKSINALVDHLEVGALIGATAVVIHPGSGVTLGVDEAISRCALALRVVLERTEALENRPLIALETCAGAGKTIGRTFAELAAIISQAGNHASLAICLDTAHLFGSGYDLASEDGLVATIADLDLHLPTTRIVAIHANDSKVRWGPRRTATRTLEWGRLARRLLRACLPIPVSETFPGSWKYRE